MIYENEYRTHDCGQLRESDIGKNVRLSGWVENIRDHGGILFIDLRDETGITQIVIKDEKMLENVTRESTVRVIGEVLRRDEETYNNKIETGTIEVKAETLDILGRAKPNLPFEVVSSKETREDVKALVDNFAEKHAPEIKEAKKQAMESLDMMKYKLEKQYNKINHHIKAKQMAKAKELEDQSYDFN